jgi:long-chain fatty acid transport protein
MTIAADAMHIKYSQIRSVANPNTFGTTGLLGSATGPGFGWDDMEIYKLGANFQVSKDLVIRAGWNHGSQPIPASETLFNVIAPAVVEDHLTLGFTMNMQGGAELSGYYMHAFEETVNGTGGAGFGAGNADISMSQNAFGITYGKKF